MPPMWMAKMPCVRRRGPCSNGGGPDPALYVTPLQLAVARGRVDVATLLLRAGAHPNARDLFGKTALHDAAARRSVQLSELLLAHGADPSATDDAGTSALHIAAANGQDGLRPLVARGASPRAQRRRLTTSDVAKRADTRSGGRADRQSRQVRWHHRRR
jgi:hypothetical protein